MPYIFDTTANPNVDPAAGDKLSLGDISDTTNNASGDTKTTTVRQVANWNEVEAVGTTAYTLVLADGGKTKRLTASSCAVTIPPESSVNFPVGTAVVIRVDNAGPISGYTVTADTGVTLDGVTTGGTAAQNRYKAMVFTKIGSDAWVADGDVGAVS
jgi:hypothetical protein